MLEISIVKILPLYPNRTYLEFEVVNLEYLKVPLPTLTFYIERGESSHATDPFTLVNPTGVESYYYVDTYVNYLSFDSLPTYRVWTQYKNKKYYSPVSFLSRELRLDEIARKRKILYDEEIVLRKFSGRKIAILKRRHVGDRCTLCYDPNTGSVTKSHCPTCFGTGFKDPYYKPFITYGARLPEYKEVDEISSDHGVEKDYTKFQILDYPTVRGQDLLVDLSSNDRYKIDRVETTEIRREIVHQELVATQLGRTDMEYRYNIGNDLFLLPTNISW